MTPLEKILVDRIRRDGPLPFAAYMSLALYHPHHGYYAGSLPRTGWRGHFVTSPELHPIFAELWARAFRDVWDAAGRPDRFHIVEVGPGEGSFAGAIIRVLDGGIGAGLTYHLVERVPAAERRQRALIGELERVTWVSSLDELPPLPVGCVFANEVLDNLPVHLLEMRGGAVHEVHVGVRDDGTLRTLLAPPSSPALEAFLRRHGVTLEEGGRYEVGLATEAFAARAAAAVGRGAVIFTDYGAAASDLAVRNGTLATYSGAGAGDDVLIEPGERDITAHVNWTSVEDALRRAGITHLVRSSQRDFLRAIGAREMEARLRRDHATAVADGRGADAVGALSGLQALGTITDPGGLGSFDVLVAAKGIAAPAFTHRLVAT